MYNIILFSNLFLNLLNLGVQHEMKELNRFNNVPLTQVIPLELLENIFRYNEKSNAVKSKKCNTNKETQLRLSDQQAQKWMPLLSSETTMPIESSNKMNNIKLNYSQLKKITIMNNSNNVDQYRETKELQTVSNILLHEWRNNEPIIELQDEHFKYVTAKDNGQQNTYSGNKKEKVTDENALVTIASRIGPFTQTQLDKKSDTINEEFKLTQTPEYTYSTKKSIPPTTTQGNDAYVVNSENGEEDISFGSDSNEFSEDNDRADSDKTESMQENKDNEINESGSIENTVKSNDFNKIKKHFDSRNGMKMTELSDSRIMLMKSHRICYACVSSTDPSCLKPNRQTAVKYCHRDNTACVAKSYIIGRSSYLMRDCGSSCMSSDTNGLALKYETCSICHSDLCNNAYSINTIIAPLILLAIVINTIIYQ